jgi:hypothetical protein
MRPSIRGRLRYLWCDLDPAGVELLSAALSATFVVLLLYRPRGATPLEHAGAYAGLCAAAAAAKALGVLTERRALGTVVVATITWLATRGKAGTDAATSRAQLAEQGRQADITLIIKTLQGQVEDLQETVRDQAQELRAARQETRECLADRDQMRGELRRVTARLATLEGEVS